MAIVYTGLEVDAGVGNEQGVEWERDGEVEGTNIPRTEMVHLPPPHADAGTAGEAEVDKQWVGEVEDTRILGVEKMEVVPEHLGCWAVMKT